MNKNIKELTADQQEEIIKVLKMRFEKNMDRHKGISWSKVEERIHSNPTKLWSLNEMELTGGEPDVLAQDSKSGEYIFFDCSPETPKDRRSICFDRQALDSRKEHKPRTSALDMAEEMGIDILTEDEYRLMQETGKYDLKTSSWIATPPNIRKLGGGLFCDRRYETVFTYHNGADSYYAARGFRGSLKV